MPDPTTPIAVDVTPPPAETGRRIAGARQRLALGLLAGAIAVHAALALAGGDADSLTGIVASDFVFPAVLALAAGACLWRGIAVHEQRVAWIAIGGGLACWTVGEVVAAVAFGDGDAPVPGPADVGHLLAYVLFASGLGAITHRLAARASAGMWLDAIIAGLAVSAWTAAFVVPQVVPETGTPGAAEGVSLAYVGGDAMLLVATVAVIGLTGWRPGRALALLAAAMLTIVVADSAFLTLDAAGAYVEGGLLETLWLVGAGLIALAAWEPATEHAAPRPEGWQTLLIPVLFALLALGMQGYGDVLGIGPEAALLSYATLAAVLARMVVLFAENQRLLRRSRHDARTDSLTGLANRRALTEHLRRRFQARGPATLLLFDLDGFKAYNDTFGHPAGDALLARLARRLRTSVAPEGQAFRMGGDEFCVLGPGAGDHSQRLAARALAALDEEGDGFRVTASFGGVDIPHEAADVTAALALADRRLYACKDGRRASPRRQARDVLMRALREREPDLHAHTATVASHCLSVGRAMGFDAEDLDILARAAELHDVGKFAIPEEILNKPGPLDREEWAFMRRHTLIGEAILSAAPALAPVGEVVRSTHERVDGAGYPDGLSGEQIPLAARIIAVCDAFDAMISDRPYRQAMPPDHALAELRRCGGTQFDPHVVSVFIGAVIGELGWQVAADEGEDQVASGAARVPAREELAGEPD